MRSLVATMVAVVTLVAAASSAEARSVRYLSRHPLPRKIGHGFCYIDVPHVHDFGPSDPRLYRQVDGAYYFVGDPAPFDYEGPRYSFYGPHPVVESEVPPGQPVYCYLNGPHYHWYQPPAAAPFEFRGGAYWYVGNYDPAYYQERPRYVAVNEVYQPIVYSRPVVDVTLAPPSFHGEIVVGPGYPRAQAFAAPPAASAGVTIGVLPPPPFQVGVGIGVGVGGPPVVVEERREIYEVRDRDHHHDNGHHHGWREPAGPPQPPHGGGWRAPPPAAHGGGWRGGSPAQPQTGGWRGAPAPGPAPRSEKHAPHGGGWRGR